MQRPRAENTESTHKSVNRMRFAEIRVRHVAYGRKYFGAIQIPIPNQAEADGNWLVNIIERLAFESLNAPFEESDVRPLKYAIEAIFAEPKLPVAWRIKNQHLELVELETLFYTVEDRLAQNSTLSELQRYHASLEFRKLCSRMAPELAGRSSLRSAKLFFRSRFRHQSTPRRLISDDAVDNRAPQGATPYDDPRLLKKEMLEKSQHVLNKILRAAEADLDGADSVRSLLNELKQEAADFDYIEIVRLITKTRQYSGKSYKLENFENPRAYIGSLIHVYDKDGWAYKDSSQGILHGTKVDRFILNESEWNARITRPWRARSFATLHEIFGCVVILQCATHWNVSSVLALRVEDVSVVNDGYIIQSFKGKTDSHTPPVRLAESDEEEILASCHVTSASDELACRAIRLLLWNHKQMVEFGHQAAHDTQLIHSVFGLKTESGSLSIQHFCVEFIKRHQLMDFSLEQLRNETLFAKSLASLDGAQRSAGHQSVRTTGNYVLQKEFAKRYYSSQNLQFQRDVEKEVNGLLQKTLTADQLKYLRAIGDGASCVDPTSPPWRDQNDRTDCEGDRCHVDGGCGNRALQIDIERVKEAVLCERVYRENWQALLSQNQHSFRQFHVPRIIFNTAYLHMISESALGYLVPKLRRELEESRA